MNANQLITLLEIYRGDRLGDDSEDGKARPHFLREAGLVRERSSSTVGSVRYGGVSFECTKAGYRAVEDILERSKQWA